MLNKKIQTCRILTYQYFHLVYYRIDHKVKKNKYINSLQKIENRKIDDMCLTLKQNKSCGKQRITLTFFLKIKYSSSIQIRNGKRHELRAVEIELKKIVITQKFLFYGADRLLIMP